VPLGIDDGERATPQSRAQLASGYFIGNLVAKPKKLEPPEPLWPDSSPDREPIQHWLPLGERGRC
jgi:hypothetical protein